MGRDGTQQPEGGGFKFDDDRPRKTAPFAFTVEEMSEKELARAAKLAAAQSAAPGDAPGGAAPIREGADPGRFEWPMVAAVLLLLPLVYWLQQWTLDLRGETLTEAPIEVRTSEEIRDPGVSELTVMSKLAVKLAFLSGGSADGSESLGEVEDEEGGMGVGEIASLAWTRTDRLRVAIVAGELEGPDAALDRLGDLGGELGAESELAADVHWLRKVYEEGSEEIPAEAAEALRARHGWFGRLALSHGKHVSDVERWEVVSGGERVAAALVIVIVGMVLVSLAGLGVGVLLIVKYRRTGYLVRYEAPAPGGSVFLETFGVFLGGFSLLLLVQLMTFGLHAEGTTTAAAINEVLLWSLVLTAGWPLARGMEWGEWRRSMGWHKGEGIRKEITCGLVGYLGCQPVVWLASWLGELVETAVGTAPEGEAASFGYGMFEAPAEGSWVLFLLGMLSAVVWAPVVEESIFRGALFRHLSGRMNLVWAAAISALCFGLIHPYTPAGLIQVASGGLMYGLMRAWRGSLIAPVVAHAVHNAVVSSFTISLIAMLGD